MDKTSVPIWSKFTDIPLNGWNVLDGRDFTPFIGDSIPSGNYRIVVVVRHTEAYPYTDLWLELEQSMADGLKTDTLRVPISNDCGRMKGSGPFGLYELSDTLLTLARVTPGWQLSVHHIMRTPDIKGINNIGIILLPGR